MNLSPKQIVNELNKHIIGQEEAKKAVAIALRNRYRRAQLSPELREEITPKNIIMKGPTGVGKTEIARRLAKLVKAPFVKVEATKYTEVGYVGKDVEGMVRAHCPERIYSASVHQSSRAHSGLLLIFSSAEFLVYKPSSSGSLIFPVTAEAAATEGLARYTSDSICPIRPTKLRFVVDTARSPAARIPI